MLSGRMGVVVVVAVAALVWLASPGRHPANAGNYTPVWDTLCARGTEVTVGCAAVRAREVVDGAVYPWRAVGRVNVAGLGTRGHCTGVLIGARTVLTAAHCLYLRARKRWARAGEIHFVAGYQRGDYVAVAAAVGYQVADGHDPASHDFSYRPRNDWALVTLDHPIGTVAGVLGWAVLDGAGLARSLQRGAQVVVVGYPGVRPHVPSVDRACGTPAFRDGGALLAVQCATMEGDSGAPVLMLEDGVATVIAVVSGGTPIVVVGGKTSDDNGGVVSFATPVSAFASKLRALSKTPDRRPIP